MLDLNNPRVFETAVDSLDVGVYLVDRHRKIVYWNRGAERISGYLRQDVTGRFCRDDILVHSDENEAVLCGTDCPLAGCMRDGQLREATVYLRHRAGHRVPVRVRAVPLRDEAGKICGAAEIFEERRVIPKSERRRNVLAKHGCLDEATELPNRDLMASYLRGQVDLFSTHGLPFSVLLIQPDRLQLFQSAHGHEAVRSILRVFAHTMKEVLRASNCHHQEKGWARRPSRRRLESGLCGLRHRHDGVVYRALVDEHEQAGAGSSRRILQGPHRELEKGRY